jgi:hypothetical protein
MLMPTGDQHYNRQAKKVTELLKICLAPSLEGKQCPMMEVATLLVEVAQVVNSHPIAQGKPSPSTLAGESFSEDPRGQI